MTTGYFAMRTAETLQQLFIQNETLSLVQQAS